MFTDPEDNEASGDSGHDEAPPATEPDYYGYEDMDSGLREGDLSDFERHDRDS